MLTAPAVTLKDMVMIFDIFYQLQIDSDSNVQIANPRISGMPGLVESGLCPRKIGDD